MRLYRTLSPLPVRFDLHRRYTLCGTFPRLGKAVKAPFHRAGVTRHPVFVEPGLSSGKGLHPCTQLPSSLTGRAYRSALRSCKLVGVWEEFGEGFAGRVLAGVLAHLLARLLAPARAYKKREAMLDKRRNGAAFGASFAISLASPVL